MRFETKVAFRYFRSGGLQSVLTVLGVAVGVTVFIFISALIGGLQKSLIRQIIGSISQVTLEPKEPNPRTLEQMIPASDSNRMALTQVQRNTLKELKIDNWKSLVELLSKEPGVTAVSATVNGPGFAIRGSQVRPITFRGIDLERNNGIIDLRAKLVRGRCDVSGQNCLIGVELQKDLGIQIGDKIRTRSGKSREQIFYVAGIYNSGNVEVNRRSFFVSLSNAQRILDLVGYVTSIETKVADVFQANAIADRLAARTGLETKSWMRQNTDLLTALRAQSGSSNMIKTFVMLSVAFGIASVLIVTVVQKQREIGILKSMGARTRSILLIFLMQGLVVSLLGALLGCLIGGTLVYLLTLIPGNSANANSRLFPAELELTYFLQAIGISVLIGMVAGIPPARRASKLDPVEVIRYG
jgi:lipoprotein-releasing system permease protein